MMKLIKGKFATDEVSEQRKKLRDALLNGEEVEVSQSGDVKPANEVAPEDGKTTKLRAGDKFADASSEQRKKLRDALLNGEEVEVTQYGDIKPSAEIAPEDGETTKLRAGDKFASSFYWYENNRKLFTDEVRAMEKFHPHFKLTKLSDGRLSWIGSIYPSYVRKNAKWDLQLVYDNNHPSNNNYGGSIRVYTINPDLNEISERLIEETGSGIPHTLRDADGNIYICTARKEDVRVGDVITSAVTALAWASKWISVFEMWMAGDVSSEEFSAHTF